MIQFGNFEHHEPTANARQLAAHNRQIYLAHIQAGFTAEEAMQVIQTILSTAMMMNGEDNGNS